jgi:3-oxoacyl-[acyl-carrier protein] reductase
MSEKNKRAIITGGSRGIGRAIAKELAANLCSSILIKDIAFPNDNAEECAETLQNEIGLPDVKIFAFKANAASLEDAKKTIDEAVKKMGGVDILINNAGITRDNTLFLMKEQDFDDVIAANLKSVFNYTKAVIRPMIQQKSGKIVNIASVVGIIGNAGQANYAASKAGVIGFTKTMARELASRGINVNAVAPGYIQTPMTDKLDDKQREALMSKIPLGKLGKTEDVARVVNFLCSQNSDYMTGQVLSVDGGMAM